MRWRFLPTHRSLVGWGGMVDRAGEDCHLVMRCWTNAMQPTAINGVCRATQIIS